MATTMGTTYIPTPGYYRGTYPWGARFWSLGAGFIQEHLADPLQPAQTWRVTTFDHTGGGPTGPYKGFPHPVQYVVDELTGQTFGLFRLWEEPNDMSSWGYFHAGGTLHKYADPQSVPVRSLPLPGYLPKEGSSTYDPFVQYRHIGISPKNKRLYVIRALGRRDHWHYETIYRAPIQTTMEGTLDGVHGDGALTFCQFQACPGPEQYDQEGAYTSYSYGSWWTPADLASPCDENVFSLDLTIYTPVLSLHNWIYDIYSFFFEDHATVMGDTANYISDYGATQNIYDNRDILVFDYDLNYVTQIKTIQGLPEDEVLLHLREKDGDFFILAYKKDAEPFNWGQWEEQDRFPRIINADHVKTDKYGWCYQSLKIYKLARSIYAPVELIYEVPWGSHSSSDVVIQAITDTHIWINWDGIRKARAGAYLSMGIKRDGSGYVEAPGLVAVLPGYYGDGNYLLCYKRKSRRSSKTEWNLDYADWGSVYGAVYQNEFGWNNFGFPTWGDDEVTKMVILDERTLRIVKHDFVWFPEEEWHNYDGYRMGEPGYGSSSSNLEQYVKGGRYRGAPQPGYSQVIMKRHYNWIRTTVNLKVRRSAMVPKTWIKATSGGPEIITL
jgi:hypothetical protein